MKIDGNMLREYLPQLAASLARQLMELTKRLEGDGVELGEEAWPAVVAILEPRDGGDAFALQLSIVPRDDAAVAAATPRPDAVATPGCDCPPCMAVRERDAKAAAPAGGESTIDLLARLATTGRPN